MSSPYNAIVFNEKSNGYPPAYETHGFAHERTPLLSELEVREKPFHS